MTNTTQTNVVAKKSQIKIPREMFMEVFFNNIVWFLLVTVLVIMGLFEPAFFRIQILRNILVQSAVLGVLTAGITFTILLGEIDLSIVGTLGFSAAVGTYFMSNGLHWILAILLILFIGFLVGAINGVLIAKLRAVSLIETLAMMITLQGALIALTKGRSIVNFPEAFKWVGQSNIFGLPILPIVFLLVYFGAFVVLRKTALGRSIYAVGGNAKSAYASGIKVDQIRICAFIISGVLAAFAGFLLASYMGAVTPTFGGSYSLYSIAAAVIGGISLTGGRGSISGVLGGVLLLTMIQVGLQVLGISSYYVNMVGGLLILAAVVIDALRVRYQG